MTCCVSQIQSIIMAFLEYHTSVRGYVIVDYVWYCTHAWLYMLFEKFQWWSVLSVTWCQKFDPWLHIRYRHQLPWSVMGMLLRTENISGRVWRLRYSRATVRQRWRSSSGYTENNHGQRVQANIESSRIYNGRVKEEFDNTWQTPTALCTCPQHPVWEVPFPQCRATAEWICGPVCNPFEATGRIVCIFSVTWWNDPWPPRARHSRSQWLFREKDCDRRKTIEALRVSEATQHQLKDIGDQDEPQTVSAVRQQGDKTVD